MQGILTTAEWSQLQNALDERRRAQYVRTLGRDSLTLDLMFCGKCRAKIYRWHNKDTGKTYGRCRNELKRSEAAQPCNMPPIPYEMLREAVVADILMHKDDLIETRMTDVIRRLRVEEIESELIELATELAARRIDRGEFTARQKKLLDERDALETADDSPEWRKTGETVGEHWERLSDAQRRLWLLRIGAIWLVHCEMSGDGKSRRWIVRQWAQAENEADRRERIVRPAA